MRYAQVSDQRNTIRFVQIYAPRDFPRSRADLILATDCSQHVGALRRACPIPVALCTTEGEFEMTEPFVVFDNTIILRTLDGEEMMIVVLKHDWNSRVVALACEDQEGEHVMLTDLTTEQLRSVGEFLIERANDQERQAQLADFGAKHAKTSIGPPPA